MRFLGEMWESHHKVHIVVLWIYIGMDEVFACTFDNSMLHFDNPLLTQQDDSYGQYICLPRN